MPRQDVPYGGAICRLKERITEIWDELGKKLHSINGVEGDAAGDVKIVSGDAAVVVTSDQVNHEIEIALDSSQLPAASVASVNGQTGTVVLDASDINVIGGSDVATDLGNLDADLQQAQTDIATEALTRANADSALQGNINAALATIPGAAATAVANDPTVAQLATDVPNKLDKITSGSSLKAYTHTGATQGETSVVDGTTANSIGVRDANGRMQAADPASGATDKTLVTANWVSQTGDSAPNNLVHRGSDETVPGVKTFYCSRAPWALIGSVSSRYKWFEVMTYAKGQTFQEVLLSIRSTRQTIIYEGHVEIDTMSLSLNEVITTIATKLKMAYYDDGTDMHIYVYTPNYGYFVAEATYINGYRTWQSPKFTMTKTTATAQDNLPAGSVEVTIP